MPRNDGSPEPVVRLLLPCCRRLLAYDLDVKRKTLCARMTSKELGTERERERERKRDREKKREGEKGDREQDREREAQGNARTGNPSVAG